MFRTDVRRRKERIMLAIISIAVLYGGWRITRAALDAVRQLPRSNDDLVYF
jgi:hypothetical protein